MLVRGPCGKFDIHVRLHGVSDTNTNKDRVANLLVKAGILIESGHESKSHSPAYPAKENAFSVSSNPMNNESRHRAADCLHDGDRQEESTRFGGTIAID